MSMRPPAESHEASVDPRPLWRSPLTWLLILVALGLGLWYFVLRTPAALAPAPVNPWTGPVPVTVEPVRQQDFTVQALAIGTVTPMQSVTVRSRVAGQLTRVLVREGEQVEQGQLLAEINPAPYQVRLAQAQGQQQQNQAQLRVAESELARYRGLFRQDAVARQQLDRQEALVQQLRGTLQADQAQVDDAKLQLSYTRIAAPIGGRVGMRRVDAGNLVAANETNGLFTILQTRPVSVLFSVPESQVAAVRAAHAAPTPAPRPAAAAVSGASTSARAMGQGTGQGMAPAPGGNAGTTLPRAAAVASPGRLSTEKIVFIGASTGGTEATKQVLLGLPSDSPAVMITQHMPPGFTSSYAQRLDGLCRIRVKEAQDGERVLPGHAYVARGGFHLSVDRSGANYIARVTDGDPVNRHRPSVEVLFQSAARVVGANALGVMLTGMGADGALAMKQMRDAGAYNLAQDEASCVVFGMPREAIAAGATHEVLALSQIAPKLLERLRVSGGAMRHRV